MTDETKADAAPAAAAAPEGGAATTVTETEKAPVDADLAKLERAKDHGYVEPAPLSKEERASALVLAFEHAAANNAPVTPAMLLELRAVIFGD